MALVPDSQVSGVACVGRACCLAHMTIPLEAKVSDDVKPRGGAAHGLGGADHAVGETGHRVGGAARGVGH